MAYLGKRYHIDELPTEDPLLPPGKYAAQVVASDLVMTKSGTGMYIKFRIQIIEGQHEGSSVFHQVNVENDSPKAQEIGLRQLGSMIRACGLFSAEESEELHGIPFLATLKVKKDENGKYPDKNEVSKVEPYVAVTAPKRETAAPKPAPKAAPKTRTKTEEELDDEIPFDGAPPTHVAAAQNAKAAARSTGRTTRKTPFGG